MMKRLMIFLIMIMVVTTSYAYTICAKNNTYVGVLRKSVDGSVTLVTNTTTPNIRKQWKTTFDYAGVDKVITGYAACNEVSGSFGTPVTNLYTNAGDAGQYCWCQMWPIRDTADLNNYDYETGITSYWVFLKDAGTAESCASNCTSNCANAMAYNWGSGMTPANPASGGFRYAVYESVW